MEYKGYIGLFTFDEKLGLFQGRVSNIKDFITFQGKSREALSPYLIYGIEPKNDIANA
jgi:predicted HicB family RNase H-like nuclease